MLDPAYKLGTDYEAIVMKSLGDYHTRYDHEFKNLIDNENGVKTYRSHSQLLKIVKGRLNKAFNVFRKTLKDPSDRQWFTFAVSRIDQAEDSGSLITLVSVAWQKLFPPIEGEG